MKLADEWRKAWRWLQTWLIAALAVAPIAYEELSAMSDFLPPKVFKGAMVLLGILTLVNNVRKKT